MNVRKSFTFQRIINTKRFYGRKTFEFDGIYKLVFPKNSQTHVKIQIKNTQKKNQKGVFKKRNNEGKDEGNA